MRLSKFYYRKLYNYYYYYYYYPSAMCDNSLSQYTFVRRLNTYLFGQYNEHQPVTLLRFCDSSAIYNVDSFIYMGYAAELTDLWTNF